MTQAELKALVHSALQSEREFCNAVRGDDNPQVVEMYNRHLGRARAFQEVLEALNGDRTFLRISARAKGRK